MQLAHATNGLRQRALVIGGLVMGIAFATAAALTQAAPETGIGSHARNGPASEAERPGADTMDLVYNPADGMTPAQAVGSDNPTVLYFYPFEMCQIRYCRQPADVAAQFSEHYGDNLNFVAVTTYAAKSGDVTFGNWDLYLVPPYDQWVPEFSETPFGRGLQSPVAVLVDGQGRRLGQADEFLSAGEIAGMLAAADLADGN